MSQEKDLKDNQREILYSVIKKNETRQRTLNEGMENISKILKTISMKSIPFLKTKCIEEYNALANVYNIEHSHDSGIKFIPKNEIENEEVVNNIDKCFDKHFSINKKITIFELDLNNTIIENKICNRECISNKSTENEELANCLENCISNYMNKFENLQKEYETDLMNISNKLQV
jgi:hypothetical protein